MAPAICSSCTWVATHPGAFKPTVSVAGGAQPGGDVATPWSKAGFQDHCRSAGAEKNQATEIVDSDTGEITTA
jgi:hypothetical protein